MCTHTPTLAPVDNEHPADMHTQSHKVPVSLAPSWLPPAAEAFVFPALPFPSLPLLATASPAPGEFCPAETQLQSWGGSRLNYCADWHLPFPRRFILFRLCRAFLVFDVSLWQHYCTAKACQLNHCADRDPPFPQSFVFVFLLSPKVFCFVFDVSLTTLLLHHESMTYKRILNTLHLIKDHPTIKTIFAWLICGWS